MKKGLLNFLPYAIAYAIDFYLLPCFIQDTGSAMMMVLCVIPAITFVISLIYGIKSGFNVLIPAFVMIFFMPTIFIYYNYTAMTYIGIYGVISAIGCGIGRIFYKEK